MFYLSANSSSKQLALNHWCLVSFPFFPCFSCFLYCFLLLNAIGRQRNAIEVSLRPCFVWPKRITKKYLMVTDVDLSFSLGLLHPCSAPTLPLPRRPCFCSASSLKVPTLLCLYLPPLRPLPEASTHLRHSALPQIPPRDSEQLFGGSAAPYQLFGGCAPPSSCWVVVVLPTIS